MCGFDVLFFPYFIVLVYVLFLMLVVCNKE